MGERPYTLLSCAMSLDGYLDSATDERLVLSNAADLDRVDEVRAGCDAILVGTGTVLADDPALTVRDEIGELVGNQPLRVVLGDRDLPAGARLLDGAADTLHLQTRDVAAALAELHDRDVQHVFVEGGPTVGAAFLAAGLVDEVVAYVAPKLLGSGRNAVADLGIESITGALELEVEDITVLGHDVRITGRFRDRRQGASLNQRAEKD